MTSQKTSDMRYTNENEMPEDYFSRQDKQADSPPKKRSNVIQGMFISIALICMLILVSASPIFAISTIEVSGGNFYKDSQIIDLSGLALGQNGFTSLFGDDLIKMFSFRCSEAERRIAESCPYIKNVQVKYSIPDVIVIQIEERSKSVVVPYVESGLLIDEEGYVVDVIKSHRQSDLPVINGFTFDKYELGKKLAVRNEKCLEVVLSIINALRQADRDTPEKLSYEIELIDVSDSGSIKLLLNSGLLVNIGNGEDVYYRISATKEIIFNGLEPGAKGIVDFSNNAKPVFIPDSNLTHLD